MITVKQHIDSVGFLTKGNTVSDYLDSLVINEKIEYIRSVQNTYPLNDNLKKPNNLSNSSISVQQLVLGQFIMIEQIITGKTTTSDHLVDFEILKLIIRPSHHNEFDNSDLEEEKKNSEMILDMDVREAYWILNKFIDNREKILFNDFAGVFYEKPEDDLEEENLEEITANEKFGQQWYWYNIVRMLSGEDIHKYEQTYMLPMNIVLPEMSFLAQKNKIESAKQRQQSAMSKL
jgi:hypothetical protein